MVVVITVVVAVAVIVVVVMVVIAVVVVVVTSMRRRVHARMGMSNETPQPFTRNKQVCGSCWKKVSGGVPDGDKDHPHYRYSHHPIPNLR